MWIQKKYFEEGNKFKVCSLNQNKDMTSNNKYLGTKGSLKGMIWQLVYQICRM